MDTQLELLSAKWNDILQTIRQDNGLSDVAFKTWLLPLKIFRIDHNTVKITAPFEQAVTYIENKYKTFLYVAVAEAMGAEYEIRIITEEEAEKEKPLVPQPRKNPSPSSETPESKYTNLNPKYTFETFVIGSNNRFAHAASVAVAESPGKEYNPLFLYGGVGLGKTHLMHSIGHFILEQEPDTKVLYVTSEQFTNEVIESIRSGNAAAMTNLRDKYRTVDVLLIDDIQFIIGKESTQEEFFHTFNVLHSARKQIILSSDKPPKDMETLEERFRSRFEWGLIADIQAPDYETRMAILRKNAENFDRVINDDILNYIASNIKSNIRELEGAFNKIIAFIRLNHVDVMTLDMAEEALKDIIYPDRQRVITPALILDTVAEHYNISPEDITSRKRNSELIQPRHVVMYLCRSLIDIPFANIAKLLNKKDHTTIIHGVNKITEDVEKDEELRNRIDVIRKKLNPS